MKLKSIILILALLIPMFAVATPKLAFAAASKFYIDPDPAIANVGVAKDLKIRLDNVADLNAWEARIRWDNKVLKYKGVVFGALVTEDIGDFNLDYVVDSSDLGIMGAAWGSFEGDPNFNPACDLIKDGSIDSSDLGTLGAHWGHFGTPAATQLATLSVVGNELSLFEGYVDPTFVNSGGANFLLITVSFDVIAGGSTNIEFLDAENLWTSGGGVIPHTTDNGYLYTLQPFVDFNWTSTNSATFDYTGPRVGETITFDGSASHSADGDTITGYSWSIDGEANGTGAITTGHYDTYSKTAHDVALTVSDSGGHSYTLHKSMTVDRDISIFSIWPSMEDYEGSIETTFVSGKYVIIYLRYANIGTITEYSDNTFGDFPSTARINLYVIHSDGTEKQIYTESSSKAVRRYWNYTKGDAALTRLYDWQPVVGVGQWKFWDLWGVEPETGLYFKANITDTVSGTNPFAGDTDLSNNELWFGPFDIVAGTDDDIREEGVWTYDEVGYYTPILPYGTSYQYGYGGKFLNLYNDGAMGPLDPYTPGTIANITVALSNVGINDETVTFHVYAGGVEIHSETDVMDVATGYFEFTFGWDTTGYYGDSLVTVYVVPVPGETGRWATWDNNTPENFATYGIRYANAYDDWIIQNSYP